MPSKIIQRGQEKFIISHDENIDIDFDNLGSDNPAPKPASKTTPRTVLKPIAEFKFLFGSKATIDLAGIVKKLLINSDSIEMQCETLLIPAFKLVQELIQEPKPIFQATAYYSDEEIVIGKENILDSFSIESIKDDIAVCKIIFRKENHNYKHE